MPKIKTTAEIFEVLCHEIDECHHGRTDFMRSKAICQLVGTLINVAKLQMVANENEEKARGIAMLAYTPNDDELDRATARLEELGKAIRVLEKTIDDPKTDESKLEGLHVKKNNFEQERLNLQRILNKRR